MKTIARCFCLFLVVSVSSCSKASITPASIESKPQQFFHKIANSGETLTIISKWYSGDVDNWNQIVLANPGLHPEKLTIGDVIMIPQDILKTREPMPASYLEQQLKALSYRRSDEQRLEQKQVELPVEEPSPTPQGRSAKTDELIQTRDDLWRELMGE